MVLIGLGAAVPLSSGPISLGHVHLDTNTLLLAGMMIVVGFQVLFFGLFTKAYCEARGLLPKNEHLDALLHHFTLERGILVGAILFLAGLGFLAGALLKWRASNFGSMSYPDSLRLVIPAVTCMTLGVQAVFSSFFLSILEVKHD